MQLVIDEAQSYITPAELRVLLGLKDGKTQKEIARELYIEPCTVKTHVQHIGEKLGSKNAVQMMVLAVEKGIFRVLPVLLIACILSAFFDVEMHVVRPMRRPVSVVRVQMRRPTERLGRALA